MQLVREGVDCSVDCMSVIPTVSFVSAAHGGPSARAFGSDVVLPWPCSTAVGIIGDIDGLFDFV